MTFDVDFSNVGDNVYSNFLIAQDMGEGGSTLKAKLDNGYPISAVGQGIMLIKEKPVTRQISSYRDS
jgi:hypothetical protein